MATSSTSTEIPFCIDYSFNVTVEFDLQALDNFRVTTLVNLALQQFNVLVGALNSGAPSVSRGLMHRVIQVYEAQQSHHMVASTSLLTAGAVLLR